MLKNPIPQVTDPLQYRAIGIVNGKFTPHDSEQLNKGLITDNEGEKIETVVLGKALSLLKKHIDLNKNYYWVVYPKNKNTQNLHLQVAGIWDPFQFNDLPNNSSKINSSKLLRSSRESSPFMTNLKFLFFKFFNFEVEQILITISFFDLLTKTSSPLTEK